MAKIKVFLIDEQEIMRHGLRAALELDPAIAVVGEAANVVAALAALDDPIPDIVILGTAQRSCIDMIRSFREHHALLRIVVLASQEEPAALLQALQAGCHGLLLRRASSGTLVSAVHAVKAGGTFLSDEAADILMYGFMWQRSGAKSADLLHHLSERERQVLDLTVSGLTSSQIAERLAISSKSVDTYRGRLMAKIGVRNASGLMSFAREHGLAQDHLA